MNVIFSRHPEAFSSNTILILLDINKFHLHLTQIFFSSQSKSLVQTKDLVVFLQKNIAVTEQ